MAEFDFEPVSFVDALPALFRELEALPFRIDGKVEIIPWTCQNCDLRRLLELKRPCEFQLHDADCQKAFIPKYRNFEEGSGGRGTFIKHLADNLRRYS